MHGNASILPTKILEVQTVSALQCHSCCFVVACCGKLLRALEQTSQANQRMVISTQKYASSEEIRQGFKIEVTDLRTWGMG